MWWQLVPYLVCDALSGLRQPRHPGNRLTRGRGRDLDPAPPRVRWLRGAFHDLRAQRIRPNPGPQAGWQPAGVRPAQARERDWQGGVEGARSRGHRPADRRPRGHGAAEWRLRDSLAPDRRDGARASRGAGSAQLPAVQDRVFASRGYRRAVRRARDARPRPLDDVTELVEVPDRTP